MTFEPASNEHIDQYIDRADMYVNHDSSDNNILTSINYNLFAIGNALIALAKAANK